MTWSCGSRSRERSRSKGLTVDPSPGRWSPHESLYRRWPGRPRRSTRDAGHAAGRHAPGRTAQATLNYLAGGDQLVAVRLTAESIGTQDLQLLENPGRDNQAATITIRLKPTSRLAGRVRNRAGQPVAGQEVEVWSKGGNSAANESRRLPGRAPADGGRRVVPDARQPAGRVAVSGGGPRPGFEPILSKWITIGEQPQVLLPMIQRPLRTIRGRVVDRQGKPLANVEVFQSGDGPERTATEDRRRRPVRAGGLSRGAGVSLCAP